LDHSNLPLALLLAILIAALSVAARRLRAPPPMIMLVAGACLAFVPGAPVVSLDPDLVLLILLPPLLYSAGVGMSWRGFRSNLRPILLLAIGCVLATAACVAAITHYLFGLSWAIGFVLGAIVSPPDAVAPIAILRRMALPRRLTTILEGESLVNDATALVALGIALTAASTGHFSPSEAAMRFVVLVAGELAYGIGVGWAMLRLRHFAAEPRAEIMLALITPFVAFWLPHLLGGSGVVACVAAGLYVSWNGRNLIRPATRLQGYFFWDLWVWAIEALVFLLTGLQASAVVAGISGDELKRVVAAAAVVCATLVVVRYLWVFAATYLPRLIVPSLREQDPTPDWRLPFLVSFTGLRGVVSLVAALLIPMTIKGQPFPDRDLVLFVTYVVIAVTIIGLGSSLPWVVRRLGIADLGVAEAATNKNDERAVRIESIDAVLRHLDAELRGGALAEAVDAYRRRTVHRRDLILKGGGTDGSQGELIETGALYLRLLDIERQSIATAYAENRITDEARRRIERELDLEEARARHALESAAGADPARTPE